MQETSLCRGRVQAYIPYQIRKSTWSMAASAKMFGTKTKAQKLADKFVERYRDKSETTGGDVHTLSWMKLYLKYCRQFDFYGYLRTERCFALALDAVVYIDPFFSKDKFSIPSLTRPCLLTDRIKMSTLESTPRIFMSSMPLRM